MGIECSIIIPTYNAEKSIIECINSIELEKEWHHSVEVIVVNDGSTDLTNEVVCDIAKKYECVKLINQENQGVSAARNAGIRSALGKYIYFMDADDCVRRNVLDEVIECATKTEAELIIADYIYHDIQSGKQRCSVNKIPYEQLLGRGYIEQTIFYRFFVGDNEGLSSLWNKLFNREIITKNEMFFDIHRTHGEDWRFVMAYMDSIENLYAVNKTLYIYRMDGSQSYSKYSKRLSYSLLDGHRTLKKMNDKYSLCHKQSKEYRQFIVKFYEQIWSYLSLENCNHIEKKHFIKDEECKETFKYIIKSNSQELQEMQLSGREKIIAVLLFCNMYPLALKLINKLRNTGGSNE